MNLQIFMGYGTNRLLKHGATAVTDVRDIICSFKELEYHEKKGKDQIRLIINVPDKYKIIYKMLENKCMDVNEISRTLQKPVNEISSLLFMMELDEFIERKGDGRYKIKTQEE